MSMGMSLIPQQQPDQRMHTVSIDEIIFLIESLDGDKPALEHYFSPSRREAFVKDYIHYLNSSLLETKRGLLDLDKYLGFVLSFQFTAPLLEIPMERELVLFYRILEERYEIDELDINLHFRMGGDESESKDDSKSEGNPESEDHNKYGNHAKSEALSEDKKVSDIQKPSESKTSMLGEEEALKSFRQELENSFEGRREVKETVQKRLKQDGIEAIMKWQQMKGIPELAEAFGRSVVIPSFFSFTDKKLLGFYRQNTIGISYEVAVPDFEE